MSAAARMLPLTLDDLANVRHMQVASVRRFAVSHLSEAEQRAFIAYLESEIYLDRLAAAVKAGRLTGAMLMDELVATAGWVPANDSGANARLISLFVSPLYSGVGLGKRVTEEVEAQAVRAGFGSFSVRAPIGSVGFFLRLGYEIASHGVWPLPPDQALPVGFLRKTVVVAAH